MTFDRTKLDNLLFLYWQSLPEPKLSYTEWWYGKVMPVIDHAHKPETEETRR